MMKWLSGKMPLNIDCTACKSRQICVDKSIESRDGGGHNVTDITFFFLYAQPLVAFVGLLINLVSLHTTYLDFRTTDAYNGERRIIAKERLESETIRTGAHVILMALGLLTFASPPTPVVLWRREWLVIANRSLLMLLTLLLAYKPYLILKSEEDLHQLWKRRTP